MPARRAIHGAIVVLATSTLIVACKKQGVAPETPDAPPSYDYVQPSYAPESETAPGADAQPRDKEGPGRVESVAPAPPAAQPASPASRPFRGADDAVTSLSPRFQAFFEDFRVAEMALTHASDACDDACRALRSMVRAAERMCAIAGNEDEQLRCERARDRVRGAREHVRRACRSCPDGPALEPDDG